MNTKFLKLFATTILLVSAIGCKSLSDIKNKFPYEMMLSISDLPGGFEYTDSTFPEIDGAISYYVTYGKVPEKFGALISHQITIYPDIESAKSSFPNWESQWFTNKWSPPGESNFKPANSEDVYSLKCLPTQIDNRQSQSCRLIQLHDNLGATLEL